MDQLQALRVFVRIAEAGAFAKGADQLAIPRSTASKLIRELEAHVGTKLIHRTTRTVTVTPEGAQYYERARRILGELDEMDAMTRDARALPKGRLRLDVGSIIANQILLPALPQFQALYPDIELRLGVSDRPAGLISEGIDCVIRGGELANTGLIARKLCEMKFVTCCLASYAEQYGKPAHPQDLQTHHNLIGYFSSATEKVFPFRFIKEGETLEINAGTAISVNESTAHLNALTSGMGIGQTFYHFVRDKIARGEMTLVLEEWQQPAYPLYLLYPPNRHLNGTIRVFVDWAVQLFSAVDDRPI